MGKIILILGGARSGKSTYALTLAKKSRQKVAFIATCQALDAEMAERIRLHKIKRPKTWQTFEEPYNLSGVLGETGNKFQVVLLDCLTLFVSNLMLKGKKEGDILNEVGGILALLKKACKKAIIVSNEVGLGIVPNSRLGRNFRDVAGKANQLVAANSDQVFFMISGIPVKIKG